MNKFVNEINRTEVGLLSKRQRCEVSGEILNRNESKFMGLEVDFMMVHFFRAR